MARAYIDLSHGLLDIIWSQGDPIIASFTVPDVVGLWGTSFQAQIREKASPAAPLLGTIVVAAEEQGADLAFTFNMAAADSAAIPAGWYFWDMQEVGGVTRLGGRARAKATVTT